MSDNSDSETVHSAMSLPLPGTPGSSWAGFSERFKALFHDADPRVCTAFWFFGMYPNGYRSRCLVACRCRKGFLREIQTNVFLAQNPGLINNVLYVVILSAALDLVGSDFPKGVVLLADVVPSFVTKLIAPYFIHLVPYSIRILIFVGLSVCGMLIIALTPSHTEGGSISTKLAGVVLASLSSGAGELSFLGMTHYYGRFSLAAWSSGTGAAGLVGAGAYALATTSFGLTVKATLLTSACLPFIMVVSYFAILPLGPLHLLPREVAEYQIIAESNDMDEIEAPQAGQEHERNEEDGLLDTSGHPRSYAKVNERNRISQTWASFQENLTRSKSLFFPL